jgi:hypothetical protein
MPAATVTDAASTILEMVERHVSTIEETETPIASTIHHMGTPAPSTALASAEPAISQTPVPTPVDTPSHLLDQTEAITRIVSFSCDIFDISRSLPFSGTPLVSSSDKCDRGRQLIEKNVCIRTLTRLYHNFSMKHRTWQGL